MSNRPIDIFKLLNNNINNNINNDNAKALLIDAFFYDMVHDFMEENPISGDMGFDFQMLYLMFDTVFNHRVANYIENTVDNTLNNARTNLYQRCTVMNKFFGMVDVKPDYSSPGRTKNYVPSILKHSVYNDIARFSNVLYHQNAVYNVLYTPTADVKTIELVENAQKSARAIPALFALTTMNKKGFSKKAVPIDVISGRYDQASKKFSLLFTKKFSPLKYTLGDINVIIKNKNNHSNLNFISILNNNEQIDRMYDMYMMGGVRNTLIQFFKDKLNKKKIIPGDVQLKYLTKAEQSRIRTIDGVLNRFFPGIGVFDTKLILRFMKQNKIMKKKQGYSEYIRQSIKYLSNIVYGGSTNSFKGDFNSMYTNSQAVEVEATLEIGDIHRTENKPSVKNVVTKLRNFVLGENSSTNASGNGTRVPPLEQSNAKIFRQKFRENSKIERFKNKILRNKKNVNFIKECFLILFSKTIGDFSQIVETIGNKNRYLVTFDKMAAIIALICDCKTIFVGDNKHEINSGMGSNSYGNFQKQGFAAVGPVRLLKKPGVRVYTPTLNSNEELFELQSEQVEQQFVVREMNNKNHKFNEFLRYVNKEYIQTNPSPEIGNDFFNKLRRNNTIKTKFGNSVSTYIEQLQRTCMEGKCSRDRPQSAIPAANPRNQNTFGGLAGAHRQQTLKLRPSSALETQKTKPGQIPTAGKKRQGEPLPPRPSSAARKNPKHAWT